jgi:DNA-binding MarR family transcriptional regulator
VARLTRAVAALVADASRGMARSFDVNRVALLRLAIAEPGITPTEAGRRLHLPPSSVTRHAQALEEAGHVVLRRNPRDRRSAAMQATDAGIKELAALDNVGEEIFAGVVADWSTEDIEQLAALIEKLTAAWARHGERHKRHRRRVSRWQHPTPQEDQ